MSNAGFDKHKCYDPELARYASEGDARTLLKCLGGQNVNVADEGGTTYLHKAAGARTKGTGENANTTTEKSDAVRFLIEHGADVNARRSDWTTPLHVAASRGNIECARLLLAAGAFLMPDRTGRMPSDVAAQAAKSRANAGEMKNMEEIAGYLRQVEKGEIARPTLEEMGLRLPYRHISLFSSGWKDAKRFNLEMDREKDEGEGRGRG